MAQKYLNILLTCSVLPEVIKPFTAQLSIPDRVLDVLMPQIQLQRPSILPIVGQLKPTRMTQHDRGRNGDYSPPPCISFLDNLARPGGNVIGFANYDPNMDIKWLELLKMVAPRECANRFRHTGP